MTAYNRPAVNVDLKDVIGRAFYDSHRAIRSQSVHTVVEEGGRGSLKSSFCSVEIVLWLLKWPKSHALVMRQMGNTLEDKLVHHSSYLDAPRKWLGKEFLDGADWLRKTKPLIYRHMYLGEMVGSGTQVFDNIVSRKITAKEIAGFDNIISGVDWGWYPDPWVFIRTYYHAGTRTLYIFDEARGNKLTNHVTAKIVKERVAPGELILADLSDEKACADYRSFGLRCWPARKGPGSRELGVKWLQGLTAIVIDPNRCPCTLQEFLEWEYEVAPDGTVLGTLMDARDHGIDAARYACSRIWQRKGA